MASPNTKRLQEARDKKRPVKLYTGTVSYGRREFKKLRAMRKAVRRRAFRAKKRGLCVLCNKPNDNGHYICDDCNE